MNFPHMTEDQLNNVTKAYMMLIQSVTAYDKKYYEQVSQKNSTFKLSSAQKFSSKLF